MFKTVLRKKEKSATAEKLERDNPYNKIADDIIGRYDIKSYYSNFYLFNGTYYKPITDIELEKIIHFEINKNNYYKSIATDKKHVVLPTLDYNIIPQEIVKSLSQKHIFEYCWSV